jgi:Effector-associated domain 11
MKDISKIRELIAGDKINEAILLLSKFLNLNHDLYNSIILIKSRHQRLIKAVINGIVSFEEQNIESNKINYSILEICKEIEKSKSFNKYTNKSVYDLSKCKELILSIEILQKCFQSEKDGNNYLLDFSKKSFSIQKVKNFIEEANTEPEIKPDFSRWTEEIKDLLKKIPKPLVDKFIVINIENNINNMVQKKEDFLDSWDIYGLLKTITMGMLGFSFPKGFENMIISLNESVTLIINDLEFVKKQIKQNCK